MFAPSYFGKLLGYKSHTLKQPKAVEFAFKAICSRFGHFSAESDWIREYNQKKNQIKYPKGRNKR